MIGRSCDHDIIATVAIKMIYSVFLAPLSLKALAISFLS